MHRFAIFITLMVLCCAVASSYSATIHVPSQQPTIQAGINAAVNGDTVLVAPGVYQEMFSYLGKSICVKGEKGLDSTVLTYPSMITSLITFGGTIDTFATLEGVTIENVLHSGADVGLINATGSSARIQDCRFRNNSDGGPVASGESIIRSMGGGFLIVERCLFENNVALGGAGIGLNSPCGRITNNRFKRNRTWGSYGGAIALGGSTPLGLNISGNLFCENENTGQDQGASSGGAIFMSVCTNINIELNTFVGNRTGNNGGALCFWSCGPGNAVRQNIFVANTGYAVSGGQPEFYGNTSHANVPSDYGPGLILDSCSFAADPLFCDTASGDFSVHSHSPCMPAFNPCGLQIGAFLAGCTPISRHVPSEYPDIQSAIDSAIEGDTILIATGIYSGVRNSDLQWISKELVIFGMGPDSTVIDCSGAGIQTYGLDLNSQLANVTIRNASAGLTFGESYPTIRNVTFVDCATGIDMWGLTTPAKVIGCSFVDNFRGIYVGDSDSSLIADSCYFINNTYAADINNGTSAISNSVFLSNTYGFSSFSGNRDKKRLTECTFTGNEYGLAGSFSLYNSSITGSSIAVYCPFYNECRLENVDISHSTNVVIKALLEGRVPVARAGRTAPDQAVDVGGSVLLIGCTILDNPCEIIQVSGIDGDIQSIGLKACIIEGNGGGISIGGTSGSLTMDSCSYSKNHGAVEFGTINPPVYYSGLRITNCTFAYNVGDALALTLSNHEDSLKATVVLKGSIFYRNGGAGFKVVSATADSALNQVPQCVNAIENHGGNYVGISDPTGINGNISENPFFCDTASGDFHIAAESPCAPANNSCNQQIGALGVACSVKPGVTSVSMEGEALTNVLSPTPKIQWAVSQPVPSPQDSFIIAVGTDNDWQFAEKWNPAPFASSDTFVTYDGSALLDGQTYYLRLRVHNTLAWSDWYQTSFRMNSVPSAPLLRAPTNLAVVGSTPTLWLTNGTDAQNDPLTYEFAGFHDTDCVAGPDINLTGVAQTADSTGGQIVDPLAENCRYFWRARAYDGFEYSAWTDLAQFLVNGTPEAPTAPTLDYPPLPDNKPIFTLLPTLTWQPSYDPDPSDTVRYKLELSDRANFSFALVRDSLLATNLPLVDSLVFGTHYYWRVTSRDKTGLGAMSSVKEFWTWKLGDMNHSHSTDLSDLSLLIAYLVQTPRPDISPKMLADLSGDCKIDLSDLSLMISFMTTSGIQLQLGCE